MKTNFIETAQNYIENNTGKKAEFIEAILNLKHELVNNGDWFKKITLKDAEGHKGANAEYCSWQRDILAGRGFEFAEDAEDMTVEEFFEDACERALDIIGYTEEVDNKRRENYVRKSFFYFRSKMYNSVDEIDLTKELEEYKKFCELMGVSHFGFADEEYMYDEFDDVMAIPETWEYDVNRYITGRDIKKEVIDMMTSYEEENLEVYAENYETVDDYSHKYREFSNDYTFARDYTAKQLGITSEKVEEIFSEEDFEEFSNSKLYEIIENK